MLNITVKELADQFEKLLKRDKTIDLGAKIKHSAVVQENDELLSGYPPGTIIFECESLNDDETHILTIYPKKLGRLQ